MKFSDEVKDWAMRAARSTVPKMSESSIMLAIATGDYLRDPLCALQLGYALMLDKPIFLIAGRDQKLPASLVRAATRIERADLSDRADLDRATRAIAEFAKNHVREDAE